ncbi:MAG TPA: KOW motif domain-containing protein [Bdellovibrionales bacterium]|mgnify:CR=1 FL=1|nr:KOW motif domain-containing protein [Bdellovibrionales bacterium]
MATKLKIKKGSTVQVIAGAEKGKKGTVLEIVTSKMGVRVQGIRIQTHFDKKDGLQKKEGLIHYSNLKLVEGPATKAKASGKAKSKSSSSAKSST